MKLGEINMLCISRETNIGLFLKNEIGLEVFLPNRYKPESYAIGDDLEVFVYQDNEGRAICTTQKPIATVNQFAYLRCRESTEMGAFMEMGIDKDMFVPKRNQVYEMEEGESYLVWIYLDELTNRLVATTKIAPLLSSEVSGMEKNQAIEILIWKHHDLGWQVIVDGAYYGMLYRNQTFIDVELGLRMAAYVNKVRDDGRIDVLIQKPGFSSVDDFSDKILKELQSNGGTLKITDKSSPEEIHAVLEMSKKSFKKAIGTLYKKRLIQLEEDSIRLVAKT